MYKVYTQDEVLEVETLQDAKDIVAAEWNFSGEASGSGFVNPWVEDEDGDQVDYVPTEEEAQTWL